MNDAEFYISERGVKDGESPDVVGKLGEYYGKRLWHQLTVELMKVVGLPSDDQEVAETPKALLTDLRGLYTNFIADFENKMNLVSLVRILVAITKAEMDDPQTALDFLLPHLLDPEDAAAAKMKDQEADAVVGPASETRDAAAPAATSSAALIAREPEASVLLLSEIANLKLRLDQTSECKTMIERARELVDAALEMSALVHSAFYRSASQLHKVVGPASDFYRNALTFLSYTPPETMLPDEKIQWAIDLGVAALVGEDIYNFGELMSHAVLQVLDGSPHDWLLRLLETFNKGSLVEFDAICAKANDAMNAHPVLVANSNFIRQKITILALMEMAFTSAGSRVLSFAEISSTCRLDDKEVELLLMRALSLKLISGSIDNVDQTISITRVQPRVLGREAIGQMAERLSHWCRSVEKTNAFLETETAELLS